jgi:hypothetical protein
MGFNLAFKGLKKFRIFLTKHYYLNLKVSEVESSHYRNVSTDPGELIAFPTGSVEHTSGTTAQDDRCL